MNNPAPTYGVCRFTVYTSTGGNGASTDGTSTLTGSGFTAQMNGMAISITDQFYNLILNTTITYVSATQVTMSTNVATNSNLSWALIASSNGVPVMDIYCYRDATNTGQGDAVIAYGLQQPDTYTIVPVFGIRDGSGNLSWRDLARQTVQVYATTQNKQFPVSPNVTI